MSTNIVGIIPARMESSRFPGKPLAGILGRAMIYHVYWRSKMVKPMSDVYIATCDKEIEDYCLRNKMNVVMTASSHERASDRTAEAMVKIERKSGKRIDIVVMIQGDEPMVRPEMIQDAIKPLLKNSGIGVVNLMSPLLSKSEQADPNEVKVVTDMDGFALYFSREPIPSWKKGAKNLAMYKQVCIIPFRRSFLIKFNKLTSTPLEVAESVDMLRVLEHGYRVKMVLTQFETYSVDTEEDIRVVKRLMRKDPLVKRYTGAM